MGAIASYAGLACLVTGASSGIGREIARELARRRARVVVTARRAARLEDLARELGTLGAPAAWAVPADLGRIEEVERLVREAEAAAGPIDVLVNNAGFAVAGLFVKSDLAKNLAMVRLNAEAPLALAHRLLPGMIARGRGGVLTVSSVAGFVASPIESAYGGTKALLRVWSHGVHQELRHTPVAITALCPGTTDTEFFDAGGFTKTTRFLDMRADPARVARAGLDGLARGRMQVIPGFLNQVLMLATRFTTARFAASVSRRLLMGRARGIRSPVSAPEPPADGTLSS
jgi:short-subunit dehydrogenase